MVGKDLGVRFVLEGSVRRAGNRLRITAQLIEAATGNHVWAERYDRPVDDIFEVQDEITINVAGAVGSEIRAADIRAVAGKNVKNLKSWERLMKAHWHFNRTNPEDNRLGQEICRSEIKATGGSAAVHSALILGCVFELIWNLGNRPPAEVFKDGMQVGRAAVERDPNDETVHANLSFLLWISGDHESAIRESKTVLELNPNSLWAHLAMGSVLAYSGTEYYQDAVDHLNFAIRLGPRDVSVSWVHTNCAAASFVSKKYDDTIEYARAALRNDPTNGTANRYLTAGLARDGQIKAAQLAWTTSQDIHPLDLKAYAAMVSTVFKKAEDAKALIQALKLAGAPFE